MRVSYIPPEAFDIVAPDVERHLAKSIKMAHGRENMESIWQLLLTGERQLWMFFDDDNSPVGWKKFLSKYGWNASYLVCEKNFKAIEEEENKDAA